MRESNRRPNDAHYAIWMMHSFDLISEPTESDTTVISSVERCAFASGKSLHSGNVRDSSPVNRLGSRLEVTAFWKFRNWF